MQHRYIRNTYGYSLNFDVTENSKVSQVKERERDRGQIIAAMAPASSRLAQSTDG